MSGPFVVSAFYKFVSVTDVQELLDRIQPVCWDNGMRGSILLAGEGINGTIAGTREATDATFAWLRADPRFEDVAVRESIAPQMPFHRMKVRLKNEIVSLRKPVDPTTVVGTYVDPGDWNRVITDPDVLVIDTRNDEEIRLGTFAGALNPGTASFSDFPAFVATLDPGTTPRIAMFCTGGIRCEKASSYLLAHGFPEVMHLRGGILNYLEAVPTHESLWIGECFVFDERVSVVHGLEPGSHTLCRGCRRPISPDDLSAAGYEEGVSCPACVGELTPTKVRRLRERHRQVRLAEARGDRHIARSSAT